MSIKDKLVKPSNIGEQIPIPQATAPQAPPLIPREQPGLGNATLGPAPSVWTTDYDRVRQWARPGMSQNRFPPLPTKADPAKNAQSSSVATKVFKPIRTQTTQNSNQIAANAAAPGPVTGLAVAKNILKDSVGVLHQVVSVSFVPPASDTNLGTFAGVNVWETLSGNQPAGVGSGITSPVVFELPIDNLARTLTVQSYTALGVECPFSSCPTISVTCDGVTTAPPNPTVSQPLTTTGTGYTFTFDFELGSGLLADVISGYNVYRSPTSSMVNATVVKHIPQPATNNIGSTYVYQEVVPAGTNYYYFVTCVNTSGRESGSTAAQSGLVTNGSNINADGTGNSNSFGKNMLTNPSFELNGTANHNNVPASAGLICNGWAIHTLDAGFFQPMTESGVTSAAHTGSNNLLIRVPTGMSLPSDNAYRSCRIYSSNAITVYGGQQLQLNGWMQWDLNASLPAGVTVLQRVNLLFFTASGTQISEVGPPDRSTPGVYANSGYETVAVPANAAYCQVECCAFIKNNSGSPFSTSTLHYADLRFDDIELVLINDLDHDVTDGFSYQRSVLGATLTPDCPYNGDFEQFANGQLVADGWTKSFETAGSDIQYARNAASYSGYYSQSMTNSASNGGSVASRPFSVKAGVTYTLSCYALSSIANPGSMYVRALWFTQDNNLAYGGEASSNDIVSAGGPTSSNVFQHFTGTVLAPAGALYCRIALFNWTPPGSVSTILFDRVSMAPSTYDLDHTVADGSTYARIKGSELATGTGFIAPVNSASTDTSAGAILNQSGSSSTINVAAWTNQYGRGQVSYNSSNTSAANNTALGYVYTTDPTYSGGSATTVFTTDYSHFTAASGNIMIGKIQLLAGGGASGGGGGGGTGNPVSTRVSK